MEGKKLTLEEAMALLDKHADAAAAADAAKADVKKKEKVKDLLKEGADAVKGRSGMNANQRRLLDQIGEPAVPVDE